MATTKSSPNQTVVLLAILLIIAGVGVAYQFVLPGLRVQRAKLAELQAQDKGLAKDVSDLRQVDLELQATRQNLLAPRYLSGKVTLRSTSN